MTGMIKIIIALVKKNSCAKAMAVISGFFSNF